jgi:hypothetical protein
MNLKNIQTEVDASFLYGVLAEKEEDENVKEIFQEMCKIEKSHAVAFLQKVGLSEAEMPKPSGRAKTLKFIGGILGYDKLRRFLFVRLLDLLLIRPFPKTFGFRTILWNFVQKSILREP